MESVESARGDNLNFRVLSVAFPFEQYANVSTQKVFESPFLHTLFVGQFQSFGCCELIRQLVEDGELLCRRLMGTKKDRHDGRLIIYN